MPVKNIKNGSRFGRDESRPHRGDANGQKQKHESDIGRDKSRPHISNDMNDFVGSSINGDQNKKQPGGVTKEHNPMLYDIHLGKIVRWFKGRCTYEIRHERKYSEFGWQSRFYDHIIRNERSLQRIRDYIYYNPLRWQVDRENTDGKFMHKQGIKYMGKPEKNYK